MKKDVFVSAIVGMITAIIWTGIFVRLGIPEKYGVGNGIWVLVIIIPIVFVFGLYLGKWLSSWKMFFNSFAKYVMIGFLNAGVDFGVFNLLMFATSIEKGQSIVFFKVASFIVAFINSYFWNKRWAFNAGNTGGGGAEFVKFATVTVIGAVLNVGITSGIVNFVPPAGAISQLSWNNLAAAVAAVIVLIWNFAGYKLVVFKS
jgi:putative flippase GtrA